MLRRALKFSREGEKRMTWKYKCGHSSEGIVMTNTIFGLVHWKDWFDSVGANGTMEKCFVCYNKELETKHLKEKEK